MSASVNKVLAVVTHSPGTAIGVGLVVAHLLIALFAPMLIPYGETQLAGPPMLAPGHADFILGTDTIGRDYLSRLLMGGRTSITVAMIGVMGAVVLATLIAVSAAYIGGLYDDVVMRLVDTKLSIPGILFVALFVIGFGRSLTVLSIVIGLSYFPGAVRTIRAQALTQVPLDYVKAARMRGEGGGGGARAAPSHGTTYRTCWWGRCHMRNISERLFKSREWPPSRARAGGPA